MNVIRLIKRLFKRKERHGEYPDFTEPLFDIGDRVLIINPNLTEMTDEPQEVGIVRSIVHLPEIDVYTYQLEGSPLYYNETWLQADFFGPKYYSVYIEGEGGDESMSDKIDTLLEIRKWNSDMLAKTSDKTYEERIIQIDTELKKLIDRNCDIKGEIEK